jgi:signal transduction histidine kinase
VRSLRARVAFLIAVAFIPAFIALFYVARNDRSEARERSAGESRALVASVADQYDSLLDDTRTLLRAIGSVPANAAVLAQCQPALAAIVRQSPAYSNLLVVRADGSVICSAEPNTGPIARREQAWFADALETGSSVGLERAGASGTYDAFTIALALDEGSGPFVVAAQIELDGLAALVGAGPASKHASVSLIDESNVLVLQRPVAPHAVGRPVGDARVVHELRRRAAGEVVVLDGPDGVRRIYTGERLAEPVGAIVMAGVPTKVAYESANRSFRVRVFGLVILTLFALGIALAFAHLSVIRRLRNLVAVTRSIGAGDLSARSEERSPDEIGELARAIDAMASELKARDTERAQLLAAVVEASEEERRRIAGDVHDDSIQVMSAQVMNLQLLRRRVDDPELKARIAELEESGRAATARLRDLVFELHSPTLEEHGLTAALETLLDRAFEGVDVATEVTSTLTADPPLPIGSTAYRIAQEAVRNARQHAHPTRVAIEVARERSDLVMHVIDDGVGFDPVSVDERPGHLGLRGMRERAAAVGGTITIDAAPGTGTTIVCRLPWLFDGSEARVAEPTEGEAQPEATDESEARVAEPTEGEA